VAVEGLFLELEFGCGCARDFNNARAETSVVGPQAKAAVAARGIIKENRKSVVGLRTRS
jgi:hypothetical protein